MNLIDLTPLTREQSAIIAAYTGIMCTTMAVLQEYAEIKLRRRLLPHQLDMRAVRDELMIASRADLDAIAYKGMK